MEDITQPPRIRYDYGGPRRLKKKKTISVSSDDKENTQGDGEQPVDSVKLKRLRTESGGSTFIRDEVIVEEEGCVDDPTEGVTDAAEAVVCAGVDGEQLGEEGSDDDEYDDEMSPQQKKALYEAVASGDVDLVDELLMDVLADINMAWFGENLLMAAIRADHTNVAEFLIDNGVDCNFTSSHLDVKDPYAGDIDYYVISCRQMAYERGMADIVDLIDEKNGDTWPFIPKTHRKVRFQTILISDDEDEELDEVEDELEGDELWEEEVGSDVTDSLLSDRRQVAVESEFPNNANDSEAIGDRQFSTGRTAMRRKSKATGRARYPSSVTSDQRERIHSTASPTGDSRGRKQRRVSSADTVLDGRNSEVSYTHRGPCRRQSAALSVTSGRRSSQSRQSTRDSRPYDVISVTSGYGSPPTSGYGESLASSRTDMNSTVPEIEDVEIETTRSKNRHLYRGTKSSLSRRMVTELKGELARQDSPLLSRRSKYAGFIFDSTGNYPPADGNTPRPISATLSMDGMVQSRGSFTAPNEIERRRKTTHEDTNRRPRTGPGTGTPRLTPRRVLGRPGTAPPFLPLINELEQFDASQATSTARYKAAQWDKVQDFNVISAKISESKHSDAHYSTRNTFYSKIHKNVADRARWSNINLPTITIEAEPHPEMTHSLTDTNTHSQYKYPQKFSSPAGYLRAVENPV